MIRRVSFLLAVLFIASCAAEDLPTGPEAFEPSTSMADLGAFSFPKFLLLDEDAIGKDLEPNSFDEGDVNEDIADIGQRTQLDFFATHVGETLTLHSGEVGDEGWFALTRVPGSWDAAGPTGDGLRNYFGAGPGLGTGGDPESRLDKIGGVTPLRAAGLSQLQGHTVCGVVYKGDISINYDPLNGSLKGDNLGTVAFRVLSVTRLTGSMPPRGGSMLALIPAKWFTLFRRVMRLCRDVVTAPDRSALRWTRS